MKRISRSQLFIANSLLLGLGWLAFGFWSHLGLSVAMSWIAASAAILAVILSVYGARTFTRPRSQRSARTSSARTLSRIQVLLDITACLIPRRLAVENLGDVMEGVHRDYREGKPPWRMWVRALPAVFWVLVDALRYCTSALLGRQRPK